MSGTRKAKAWRFLLIAMAAQFWCAQAPSSPHAQAVPSLREFFQELVEHYNPSALPKHEELFKVTDQIPSAPPRYISEALPAITVALAHHDDSVKGDAALALLAIGQRPDSAELLKGYIGAISRLFDSPGRLQAMPLLILPNLRPTPPPEVFPLLLAFLRRTDRNPIAQADAMRYLVGRAPEKPEAVAAAMDFWSRPLDKDTRIAAMRALANSGSKDPHIINLVISSLDDRDFNVRWTAFEALTRMGPVAFQQARPAMQKVADDFLALLKRKDGDVNMQVSAVNAILQYAPDDPQVTDAIEELFSRPLAVAPRTSVQNALRIPHIKNLRLIDLVIASLRDPNPEVRSNAAYVLIAMGPQALVRAQPALERLVNDPDQPAVVKGAAGKALEEIRRNP